MSHASLFLIPLALLSSSAPEGEIGRIKTTLGTARVERAGTPIPASSGQVLVAGDWLETGKDGRISLTFVDDTRFAVGPDSRIALSKFEYDPTTQKGSFIAKVERGSIAVVSGRIAKTRCGDTAAQSGGCGMEVQTPKSDIAVRGTRFILVVPR